MTGTTTIRRRHIRGTISDLVSAGLLSAGATLTFKRAGKTATAKVSTDGELIVDGKAYTSPSAAAQDAHGIPAVDGWIS